MVNNEDTTFEDLKTKTKNSLDFLTQLKETVVDQSTHLDAVLEQKNNLQRENEQLKANHQREIERITNQQDRSIEILEMKELRDLVKGKVETYNKKGNPSVTSGLKAIVEQINRIITIMQQN